MVHRYIKSLLIIEPPRTPRAQRKQWADILKLCKRLSLRVFFAESVVFISQLLQNQERQLLCLSYALMNRWVGRVVFHALMKFEELKAVIFGFRR